MVTIPSQCGAFVGDKQLCNAGDTISLVRVTQRSEAEVAEAIRKDGRDQVVFRGDDGDLWVVQSKHLHLGQATLFKLPAAGQRVDIKDARGATVLSGSVVASDNEIRWDLPAHMTSLLGAGLLAAGKMLPWTAPSPAAYMAGHQAIELSVMAAAEAGADLLFTGGCTLALGLLLVGRQALREHKAESDRGLAHMAQETYLLSE